MGPFRPEGDSLGGSGRIRLSTAMARWTRVPDTEWTRRTLRLFVGRVTINAPASKRSEGAGMQLLAFATPACTALSAMAGDPNRLLESQLLRNRELLCHTRGCSVNSLTHETAL